jgi:hypothetical protein
VTRPRPELAPLESEPIRPVDQLGDGAVGVTQHAEQVVVTCRMRHQERVVPIWPSFELDPDRPVDEAQSILGPLQLDRPRALVCAR